MRFDTRSGESVTELLARINEAELERILTDYGEERFSRTIARQVIVRRRAGPVRTTRDLVEIVTEAIPAKVRRQSRSDPATRVFQALRIAVNEELRHLEEALKTELYQALAPGGRLVIITFHSLEDRLVKNSFREADRWQVVNRKPVSPAPAEVRINPRSRSAQIRCAMKK
jgi:16S rRNA (cytosine1402-N4)-methyltransferase